MTIVANPAAQEIDLKSVYYLILKFLLLKFCLITQIVKT